MDCQPSDPLILDIREHFVRYAEASRIPLDLVPTCSAIAYILRVCEFKEALSVLLRWTGHDLSKPLDLSQLSRRP